MAPSTYPIRKSYSPRTLLGTGTILLVLAAAHAPLGAAISLNSMAPQGATRGVTVQLTGSGFAAVASDNDVILTPAVGSPVVVPGVAIAVLNATTGLQRLAFVVP